MDGITAVWLIENGLGAFIVAIIFLALGGLGGLFSDYDFDLWAKLFVWFLLGMLGIGIVAMTVGGVWHLGTLNGFF